MICGREQMEWVELLEDVRGQPREDTNDCYS